MKKQTLLAIALIIGFSVSANAMSAKDYDLSGFKPGMTLPQVQEKVSAFNDEDRKGVNIFKADNKLKDNEPYIRKITAKKDKTTLEFEFVPTVNNDNIVLYRITYQVPGTTENVKNLLDAAYTKFGDPKYGDRSVSQTQEWCDQGKSTKRCKGITLKYIGSSNYLTLTDESYLKTYQDAVNKVKIEL